MSYIGDMRKFVGHAPIMAVAAMAILYNEEKGGYELSPAYDITPTPNKPEHEMTVLGNGCPKEEDLLSIGKEVKLSIKECKEIIDIVKYVLKNR